MKSLIKIFILKKLIVKASPKNIKIPSQVGRSVTITRKIYL